MANHLKGEVEVESSRGKLVFRLGINEMISAQNDLGLAEDDQGFLNALDNLRSLKKIRTIIFNGLRGAQPEITESDAGDLITELGVVGTVKIIKEALRWALPEKEDESGKGGRGKPPRPSGGPSS
jgi:hypothetical protein